MIYLTVELNFHKTYIFFSSKAWLYLLKDWRMDWTGEEEIVEKLHLKCRNDFNSFMVVDSSSSESIDEKLYRLVCEVMKRNPQELEGKEKKVWYLVASD